MMLNIPGKILIVDDERDDYVNNIIHEFIINGHHTIYSDILVNEDLYKNVRILIMDYHIDETNEDESINIISTVINNVYKYSKYFMVIMWSGKKLTMKKKKEMKKNIIQKYDSKYGVNSFPVELFTPIQKDELSRDKIFTRINWFIDRHINLKLLYEIDNIIDKARDEVVNQVYDIGNWSNFIKNLSMEYNISSLNRELLETYINIIRRNLIISDDLNKCLKKIIKKDEPFNDLNFGKIYSYQYYHNILSNEQINTGDVIFNSITNKHYIIITPECDINHNKHTSTKLIEGIIIDHNKIKNHRYIKQMANKFHLKNADNSVNTKKVIEAMLFGYNLTQNYFNLIFLKIPNKNIFFHLILDFNKVTYEKKATKMEQLNNFSRICRLDRLMINSVLQSYSAFCSRIGTISIPKDLSSSIREGLPPNIP